MMTRRIMRRFALVLIFVVVGLFDFSGNAWSQKKAFSNFVISEAAISEIKSGHYSFRASILTIAPKSGLPFHVHKSPGLRYVLEGAVTIQWKDRGSQTYAAGSTFHEAAGENHPKGGLAAFNPLDVPAKILIVELVSAQ